ncbi:MAG: hypothetical protein KIS78_33815 [Labilithrix sp.]|nr:hypothetical protein [Labilithrix sp.]
MDVDRDLREPRDQARDEAHLHDAVRALPPRVRSRLRRRGLHDRRAHPLRGDRLGPYVDTDLSFAFLYAPERSAQRLPSGLVDTYHEHLVQPRVRAIFGWRFVEHFGLFAGASVLLQARVLRDGDEAVLRVGPEFVAGVEL